MNYNNSDILPVINNTVMSASTNNRERKNLEASQIALKRPSLNNKLETKLLHLFRNGVT